MNKVELNPKLPVLIVDDETYHLESCSALLYGCGVSNQVRISDSREVIPFLSSTPVELVVMDLLMPHVGGRELLDKIAARWPEIPVIIMTGVGEVDIAVDCMRNGAYDYLQKPVDGSRFTSTVTRALEFGGLRRENSSLKHYLLSDDLENPETFREIVSKDRVMRAIFQYVESIAKSSFPVLITGETGVGKELIAKSIHLASKVKGEFVPVNTAGLDDNMFSDTLFGHQKGAYTGADRDRKGLIERAAGGTLFLDEIGDLTEASQVKLLRLLQEREYYPLGSDLPKMSLARIVTATQKDVHQAQEKGEFRSDLFYRLQTHHIHIPPLRERLDDIPPLIDHFLELGAMDLGKKKPTPPVELYTLLSNYHFPGNVRELQSLIQDAVSMHKGKILSIIGIREKLARNRKSSPVSEEKKAASNNGGRLYLPQQETGLFPTLKEVEKYLIGEAMRRAGSNQTIAAEMLGLSRAALNKRLNREAKG
ncbi:MAG: sigma-54 dependent transcriptional regulator [Nitrospinota bacterium]|nr:sigma-54 dependent transcriptional regulator [Nitrospinota bacterium]MDH5678058.1 sigma-54 dependent transcriptional regulator [Nitrospinota bacterium]MDH5755096.1 sigma-54 dependent transcriptional regulator [Nitrospinota bacterium]